MRQILPSGQLRHLSTQINCFTLVLFNLYWEEHYVKNKLSIIKFLMNKFDQSSEFIFTVFVCIYYRNISSLRKIKTIQLSKVTPNFHCTARGQPLFTFFLPSILLTRHTHFYKYKTFFTKITVPTLLMYTIISSFIVVHSGTDKSWDSTSYHWGLECFLIFSRL